MTNIFFIGDPHFGHKEIVHPDKPRFYFSSYTEMEETLIENWNSTVSKNDEVWILGDICITKKSLGVLKKLNGTHKAVLGNHDTFRLRFYYEHFKFVAGAYKMYIKGREMYFNTYSYSYRTIRGRIEIYNECTWTFTLLFLW